MSSPWRVQLWLHLCKLEYKGKETTYHDKPKGKMSKYILLFSNPPKVNVREEYLIYDAVALISAIGGTMGLCIGFSFYNLTHVLASWMEFGVMRILRNSNLTHQQWHAKPSHVIQRISLKNLDTMSQLEDQFTDHFFSN